MPPVLQRLRNSRRIALAWAVVFALAWIVMARPHVPQLAVADFICSAGGPITAGAVHDEGAAATASVHCALCTFSAALPTPDFQLPPAPPAARPAAARQSGTHHLAHSGLPAPSRGPPAGIRLSS